MRRYAANRDRGEADIVVALRKAGARVLPMSFDTRAGVPDLLVAFRGRLLMLEVKDEIGAKGGTSRDGQQLSRAQVEFHREWQPHCDVVRSPIEALQAIGAVKIEEG